MATLSWYYITIQVPTKSLYEAFFQVNNLTDDILAFYELSNGIVDFTNNILGPLVFPSPYNSYAADNKFISNNFTSSGINIVSSQLQNKFNETDSYINIYNNNGNVILFFGSSIEYFQSNNQFTMVIASTSSPIPAYSNTCFPKGTPIDLDQGLIDIDKINTNIHTIRGKKIESITRTITQDKYLVCIEKDALAKNIPSQKTLISKNHKLFYNKMMIPADDLLRLNNEKIYKQQYSGEVLYNILLEKEIHDKMLVNNLICETLDPNNGIAKMYYDMKKANYNDFQKFNFIKKYNEYVIKNKIF